MRYCKSCLTTDLRPGSLFDSNGICIACQYATFGNNVSSNFELRLQQLNHWLRKIQLDRGRKNRHRKYDCVVGVSGGKDSTRQAHWVRDRLGMTPLLVCCAYPPRQMSEIGANNLENLISMGFDLEVVCPAPLSAASLSLQSFRQFGNVCKSTEMALFATVPRIAIEKKIPVIFWGENPATQVGDAAALAETVYDGSNLRKVNTLTEGGWDWIVDHIGLNKSQFYQYPSLESMNKYGVSIVYLGPAWDDWSEDENATYASLSGLSLRPFDELETGDITGACMLDEEFTNINMMIKYFKFGFGRATDTVNELIRQGRITRESAIPIVEKFDGVCSDRILELYCEYVGISINEFWSTVNNFVNRDLFEVTGARPVKKFSVGRNGG